MYPWLPLAAFILPPTLQEMTASSFAIYTFQHFIKNQVLNTVTNSVRDYRRKSVQGPSKGGIVKPPWLNPFGTDNPAWGDHFPISGKFYVPLNSM